ncbi:MAG: flavodoxin [Lachnospiraceae bacterium]|nr:flavodoxin [Lachnospiraceae bacterium]
MSKVSIVYWSGTGNTAAMAAAVAEGVKDGGAEAELLEVSAASVDALKEVKAIALGCPSMGAEQLEESEMEPFMEELDGLISGKTVALFGSYGWGNQEWMRDWENRIQADGATVLNGEGITVNGAPGEDTLEDCRNAGRGLAGIA